MPSTWLLAALLSPFAATSAAPTAPLAAEPLMIGVDSSTPADRAALLWVNQPDTGNTRTDVVGVRWKMGHAPGGNERFGNKTVAAMAPGRYVLYGSCVTPQFSTTMLATVELVGGKRYIARCTGRTSGKIRLEVTEIEAAP